MLAGILTKTWHPKAADSFYGLYNECLRVYHEWERQEKTAIETTFFSFYFSMLNTMGQDFKNGDLISVNICLKEYMIWIIIRIRIIIKLSLHECCEEKDRNVQGRGGGGTYKPQLDLNIPQQEVEITNRTNLLQRQSSNRSSRWKFCPFFLFKRI